MMRWTPNTTTDVSQDNDTSVIQELLDSVVGAVIGMGARSVVLAVMVALIVAAVVFGLSPDDVVAGGRYCRDC